MTEQWQAIDEQVKIACSPNAKVEDLRKLREMYQAITNTSIPSSNALNN